MTSRGTRNATPSRSGRGPCPVCGKDDGCVSWKVTTPRLASTGDLDRNLAELDALDPPPKSVRDVKERMSWGTERAMTAFNKWRDLRNPPKGEGK